MNKQKEIHSKLTKQCSSDYQIKEIILFAYPYRRIKITATVNKSPEQSLQQVYTTFIRAILAGYDTEEKLIQFLGLYPKDFILEEIYFLIEKGYLSANEESWTVTTEGQEFIANKGVLKVLEEEDFEFLIDGRTDKVLAKDFKTYHSNSHIKKLAPSISYRYKDPALLNRKNEQLIEVYNQVNNGQAHLINYDKSNIKFDSLSKEYREYYLIEYIPIPKKKGELEAYIEIRNTDKDFSKEKTLTEQLYKEYPQIVFELQSN